MDIEQRKSELDRMNGYLQKEQTFRDFHSVYSIQLGELIESGFDWGRDGWSAYNTEVRERVNKLIEDRYFFREISSTPPARFKKFITRKLNETAPRLDALYKVIEDERMDILETGQYYDKDRQVFSEYPQSQIQGSSDYASNANDHEKEGKTTGSIVDMMVDYQQRYLDLDMILVNAVEVCFTSLLTSHINAQ